MDGGEKIQGVVEAVNEILGRLRDGLAQVDSGIELPDVMFPPAPPHRKDPKLPEK